MIRRQRSVDIKTLDFPGAVLAQKISLLSRFDALGHDGKAQRMTQREHSLDHALVLSEAGDVPDEGAVYLDAVDGGLPECCERSVTATKVIDSNPNP